MRTQDAHNSRQIAGELLDRYGDSILRYAYSHLRNFSDAEDVLQETLVRYLETMPTFPDEAREKKWLIKVAGNLAKDALRRRKVRAADELREELMAEDREDLAFVWEAVGALPVPCRDVIHLYYHEGCSAAEIADILTMKVSTVRSHLKRGRERLKEILGKEYDFDE